VNNGPSTSAPYYVNSIAVSGTTVYAGGHFFSIGGQSRNYIAALDATSGNVLAWNPNVNIDDKCLVECLAVSGTTIYAGGTFDNIGGQGRTNIAALDATTGNATAWDPRAFRRYLGGPTWMSYGDVKSIAVSGTTIYAGGTFDSIGGQGRHSVAALDATTGNALAWNPNQGGNVSSIAVSGSTVYVGGSFIIGQGIGHPYFARFDSSYQSPVASPITSHSGLNNASLQIIGSNFRSGALVKFAYSLPKAGHVSLRLYGLNGQLQSELVNKHQNAGNYTLTMQRASLAAGAYLVVFKAGDYHQEKMISLTK
jgi:hypothetical protein